MTRARNASGDRENLDSLAQEPSSYLPSPIKNNDLKRWLSTRKKKKNF